jgi:hypothetical protein
MTLERGRCDLLVILTAEPYTRDALTTVLRLVRAVLDQGRTVRVWACGHNTLLTRAALGDTKPPNARDPGTAYPSTAAVIGRLIDEYGRRLGWSVCTVCAADRGADAHIPQVRLRSIGRFADTVAAADRTVYVGG